MSQPHVEAYFLSVVCLGCDGAVPAQGLTWKGNADLLGCRQTWTGETGQGDGCLAFILSPRNPGIT